MDYPVNNNHRLINFENEKEFVYLSVEESEKINNYIAKEMIKAKREHIKNQALSRRKSLEIIFNA